MDFGMIIGVGFGITLVFIALVYYYMFKAAPEA